MSDSRGRYPLEASPEDQAFYDATLRDAQAVHRGWRPSLGLMVFGLALLVWSIGLVLESYALTNLCGALIFTMGPAMTVIAARTPAARALATCLVLPIGLGWWLALGTLRPQSHEPGAVFGACFVVPLIAITIMFTMAGLLSLRRSLH
ncbi:MAG: hypothetical protein KJ747_03645 [Actinobacteria bacterium]|nr:hypothetical protein [Actinomycetota bacterium]MCG2806808.1 hypothetical protein [Coriobacteriia bacterium]